MVVPDRCLRFLVAVEEGAAVAVAGAAAEEGAVSLLATGSAFVRVAAPVTEAVTVAFRADTPLLLPPLLEVLVVLV